jgi:predicted nucleic acid-binding Zn ribbon protein
MHKSGGCSTVRDRKIRKQQLLNCPDEKPGKSTLASQKRIIMKSLQAAPSGEV